MAATVDIAPGYADIPLLLVGGERPKRSVSFPENDARRLVGEEEGEFSVCDIACCEVVSLDGNGENGLSLTMCRLDKSVSE